jgi:hypothetical protein
MAVDSASRISSFSSRRSLVSTQFWVSSSWRLAHTATIPTVHRSVASTSRITTAVRFTPRFSLDQGDRVITHTG